MKSRVLGYSLIFLMILGSVSCGPTIQQNMRKSSLGVLESLGALQDLEKSVWDSQLPLSETSWVISRDVHRRFNARMEQMLIVGRQFHLTAWQFPDTKIGLEQARLLSELLGKVATDLASGMVDGPAKTSLLIAVQVTQTSINTALIIVMENQK